jgi:SAM-dependent methyltransferase
MVGEAGRGCRGGDGGVPGSRIEVRKRREQRADRHHRRGHLAAGASQIGAPGLTHDPSAVYDRIGIGYSEGRRSDPTWSAAIDAALGDAVTVINVGAGHGSYESNGRRVIAVEPSKVMLDQRPPHAAPAIRAVAERLPIIDDAADAALAVLTVHHWDDWQAGIDELCRVAPRRVVVHFDPAHHDQQWLIRDYVPEIADLDASRNSFDAVVDRLQAEVTVLPLSRNFTDGVIGAYWCRPHAYLDPEVRSHMSGFAQIDPSVVDAAMARLADDLRSGDWARRNAGLAEVASFDAGFRLLVSAED